MGKKLMVNLSVKFVLYITLCFIAYYLHIRPIFPKFLVLIYGKNRFSEPISDRKFCTIFSRECKMFRKLSLPFRKARERLPKSRYKIAATISVCGERRTKRSALYLIVENWQPFVGSNSWNKNRANQTADEILERNKASRFRRKQLWFPNFTE